MDRVETLERGCEEIRSGRVRHGRPVVVAIPARDEAGRIHACLTALFTQRDLAGRPLARADVSVVVLANNCRDDTAEVARRFAGEDRVKVLTAEFPSPSATAGMARRTAMDAALALAPERGDALICTTDADSRPWSDWIARLWQAVDGGAQAVAGVVEFDPQDRATPVFSSERRREADYSALQAEIAARVDPEAHNPWPNHLWAWGANLAVTASAYARVGGLPPEPVAEDRAFIERLRRYDVPVRHCLDARVWTSARRDGRAAGGLSTLIDDHSGEDLAPCDALLEPVLDAYRRAAWRARLRTVHASGHAPDGWAGRLGLLPAVLDTALQSPGFGGAWSCVEGSSPLLARRRLQPKDLGRELERAKRLLRRVTGGEPADPDDRALAATAGLWSSAARA